VLEERPKETTDALQKFNFYFRRIRNRLIHMQQQLPYPTPNRAICSGCDFPVL
jgi:hypothetical protein